MKLATALALALFLGVVASAQQVYEVGNGVSAPVVVKEAKPQYTPTAMEARIQGTVWVKAVVLNDGRVGEVVVERSLDPELDQQAIKAMKEWEFKPAMREGKPVAARITVEFAFTLKAD